MIDESPIKVQDKDKPGACHQRYVWANVMRLIQLLYAIEALARESEMSHEQRHALRLDKSLWGTNRKSNLNQSKVTANPQDDFLKQKTNKKSGTGRK